MNSTRTVGRIAVAAITLAAALGGCIDTTIPDLGEQLGTGRTAGPACSPDVLADFPPEQLRITFIDVGQGDAIWIRTPWYDNRELESLDILVDAGPSGTIAGTSPGGQVVVDWLLTRGLAFGERIDALVVTHAHEDHFGGVPAVANAFEIERYVDPGFVGTAQTFGAARGAATSDVNRLGGEVDVPAIPELVPDVDAATDLFGPYVGAFVLWSRSTPPSGNASNPSGTDVNNTSVAFALEWGGQQVLLMADVEEEVEQQIVAAHDAGRIDLTSAVLKVAHHGSSSSTSPGFLARVFPGGGGLDDWAIISSGRRDFGGTQLPTEQTLAALAAALPDNHVLSTENNDELKAAGTEHGDDHIIVTIDALGAVEACYVGGQ